MKKFGEEIKMTKPHNYPHHHAHQHRGLYVRRCALAIALIFRD